MGDFFIKRRAVLGPPAVLAEQEAMVGRHDQHGVLPQPVTVKIVQQLPEAAVAAFEQPAVLLPRVCSCFGRLADPAVGRPVKWEPIVIVGRA